MSPWMRFLSRSALALAVLGAIFTACGDDDPVATDSPCSDEDTACLSIALTPDDLTYTGVYDPGFDETYHSLSWATGATLDFGPGRRMIVTIFFNPPVVVRHDHANENFSLGAGIPSSGQDGFANFTPSLTILGEWNLVSSQVRISRATTTGAAQLVLLANFGALEEGTVLRRVTYDFVVPETYPEGVATGAPVLTEQLGVSSIQLDAAVPGDSPGDPVVWQDDSMPLAAGR
ncbi:MAG TPA: hypothetical protein VFT13_07625 [Candidatus Krumholzibacteria bacterium]|nr:hypothetical protein [Candidatus Krumholzibacteria bacterium]